MNTIARAERRQNIATPGFRDLFASLVLLLIIGIFISLTVWRGVAFINVGYQIRGMEKKQTDLLNLNLSLNLQYLYSSYLTSPHGCSLSPP